MDRETRRGGAMAVQFMGASAQAGCRDSEWGADAGAQPLQAHGLLSLAKTVSTPA